MARSDGLVAIVADFETDQGFILETSSRHLIFHGAVVLLAALFFGVPYAKAI